VSIQVPCVYLLSPPPSAVIRNTKYPISTCACSGCSMLLRPCPSQCLSFYCITFRSNQLNGSSAMPMQLSSGLFCWGLFSSTLSSKWDLRGPPVRLFCLSPQLQLICALLNHHLYNIDKTVILALCQVLPFFFAYCSLNLSYILLNRKHIILPHLI
jgi:hypothetical protein